MYAALYTRKRSFCKNVKFGSFALAFHYVSCFNTSLSRYHVVDLFRITLWKVSYRPAHVSIMRKVGINSSAAKKDRLEFMKSHWKRSEIYRLSRSTTQNFLCRPTMVADISEYFESPSKKFLATSLLSIEKIKLYVEIVFIPCISTMANIKVVSFSSGNKKSFKRFTFGK